MKNLPAQRLSTQVKSIEKTQYCPGWKVNKSMRVMKSKGPQRKNQILTTTYYQKRLITNIKHTMTQSRFKNSLEKALMNYLNLKDSTKRTYDDPENPLTVERAREGIQEYKGENINPLAIKKLKWKKVKNKIEKIKKSIKTYVKQPVKGCRYNNCSNTWNKIKNLRTTGKVQVIQILGGTDDWKTVSRNGERV